LTTLTKTLHTFFGDTVLVRTSVSITLDGKNCSLLLSQ